MITEFAFETPLQSLDMQATHGDYLFGIATWARDFPDYSHFLLSHSENCSLYLDNGAFEEGKSMDVLEYLTIIESLMPDYVVAPDVIKDSAKTIQMSKLFFLEADQLPDTIKVMVVPQGKTVEEWVYCFHVMVRKFRHKFDMVGIPRCMYPHRLTLVRHVLRFARGKKIHLLGCGEPSEVAGILGSNAPITSIDTSWPARQSLGRTSFDDKLNFEDDVLDFNKFTKQVERFLKICKGDS